MLGVIEVEDETRLTEAERLDVAAGTATENARAAQGAEAVGLYELSLELHELRTESTAARHSEHLLALGRIEESMRRLAALDTRKAILDRAPAELCRSCGFARAMVSTVDGTTLTLDAVHVESPDELQQTFIDVARATPPRLVHLLAETELLRRRSAILVTDPRTDPRTFKPLVEACRTPGYVAAPLSPRDQVVGILHADHGIHGPLPDDLDREAIRSFALGLGWTLERAASRQRLAEQSDRVRRVARMLDDALAPQADDDKRPQQGSEVEITGITPSSMPSSNNLLDELLTRREREVLELLSEGASNAAIAERLVIAEATVKSHVKHILRKLRAANRTEAVSRYARLRERPTHRA
jgi:LuxR family transcriptional regulator, regulator of acetate metabolism